MKRKYIGLAIGLLAGFVMTATVSFAEENNKDKELLSFKPSNLQWEKTKADFIAPSISTCAGCHPRQYEEWRGSMHFQAFQDPIYLGELMLAVKAVGKEVTKQCEGCHTAAAVVMGETEDLDFEKLSPLAKAGVSCDVCHSFKRYTHWDTPSHEPENGSYVLSPGRNDDKDPKGFVRTKYGPFPDYEGCGGGFHECIESPKHLTAELCAGCHHVYHYDKHFPYEFTYGEWKKSLYALNGIQCQDCHMVDFKIFLRSADHFIKPKRNEYHHYFNGANFLMYYLRGIQAEREGDQKLVENLKRKYEMAVGRLQAAAEIEIDPMYNKKGDLYKIRIRVHNRRAGHNLPTSLTAVRQMWLEVLITDKSTGKELLKSGYVKEGGALEGNTIMFDTKGTDEHEIFQIDPWKVVSNAESGLIPPKGYRDIVFTVLYPPGPGHELDVHAKLRFRQASQAVAEKLLSKLPKGVSLKKWYGLDKVPPVPIVDMTETNVTVKSTGEPSDEPTVMKKLKTGWSHVHSLLAKKEKSFYEQLGGEKAVDAAVDLFYKKVLADSRVNGFFKGVNMERQRRMQKAFLTFAFGGPNKYSGKNLRAAHAHLVAAGLNDSHFDAILEHLGASLKELGVKDELIQQAAKVANSVRNDVLGK